MTKSRRFKGNHLQVNSKNRTILYLIISVILILTALLYYQVFEFDFVYWDDDVNVYENPLVINFNWSNFISSTISIFSSDVIGNYNPLPIWTFGIENAVYGTSNPGIAHIINLLIHLICTFFVFKIGLQLNLRPSGSGLLAFLFALHPMHVESVAWITERKDVLYGLFFLWAIYLYILQKTSYSKSRILWITILFLLSLFSKIQAVTLPLVFILIDYWFEQKITLKSIFNQWLYLLLSIIFGALGIYFLSREGSLDANQVFGLVDRIFIGSYSLVVYLIKAIAPYKLSPLYPYPPALSWYHYASIIIFPAYIMIMYRAYMEKRKALFFGLGFFIVNIVFLLQILGAGQGLTADRFSYISYIGLFFIAGYYFSKIIQIQKFKSASIVLLTIPVIVYSVISYEQIGIWRNSETLWSKAIAHYPMSTLAYGNRANYLRDQGRYREALADYNNGLKIKPDQAKTLNSRAKLYFTLASNADTLNLALADYSRAIELDPDNGEYYINRGATYARLGYINQGLKDINTGLNLKPDHAAGYANRYVINSQLGNFNEALQDITSYLALNPYDPDFIYERASVKLKLGINDNSILEDFNKAISINPNKGIYHYRKCILLLNNNRIEEARTAYNTALKLGFRDINPEVARMLGN